MDKKVVTQLSKPLFEIKVQIEKDISNGNKTDAELLSLIESIICFLKEGRKGTPVAKGLPIFRYFEVEFGVSNLFVVDLRAGFRGFYTRVSNGEFEILQIILDVISHKEYEKRGHYNKH